MIDYDLLFRVCMFADETAEKRVIVSEIFGDSQRENTKLTIGIEFYDKIVEFKEKFIKLYFWDISFQDRFKKLLHHYLYSADGILLIYDVSNNETLNSLRTLIEEIKEEIKEGTPILLVGNKSDLDENREVSEEQLEKFKIDYDISLAMEISAKTGENVEEMFLKITDMIFENYD